MRLFERLGAFEGLRILDLFAGTGTIGLEAVSRGAASAVFIERDHKAFELLKGNVDALGLAGQTLCWRTDANRCSFRPKGRDELFPYDRVFCDPPYAIARDIDPAAPLYRVLARLARRDVTAVDVELILRVPARATLACPSVWNATLLFSQGGMAIYLLRRAEPGGPDADSASTQNAPMEDGLPDRASHETEV